MDSKKNTLILTIGLPFSGKTSWCLEHGAPIVCPDAIRLSLHGERFSGPAEEFVWAISKVMVRALFLAGHQVVILDACNNTAKRRDAWQSDEWIRQYIVFDVASETCLTRAAKAKDITIMPIIKRMAKTQEYEGVFYGESFNPMADYVKFPGQELMQTYHAGNADD